jgi:hypothetical protein
MLVKDNRKCTWYGEEITETQYNEILSMLRNRPNAPEGFAYRLTQALEWELYELPPAEPEELSETEQKALAYDILMGVSE